MKAIIQSLMMLASLGAVISCGKTSFAGTQSVEPTYKDTQAEAISDSSPFSITHSVINPPLPGRDISAGYFTLYNSGPADRLIAARASISPIVELHTHIEDDGIMRMRRIEGIDIGAGESLSFEPGGYHLMLFKTHITKRQRQAEITLVFEKHGEVKLTVPLRNKASQGSGHGSGNGSAYGSDTKTSDPQPAKPTSESYDHR